MSSEPLRPIAPREFLTVEDLAAELQLGQRAVRRLIATGEIPGLRIGRKWYCRREALVARFRAVETQRKDRKRRDEAELDRVVRALTPHSVGGFR
jgi:excisionase family DNA binding protein